MRGRVRVTEDPGGVKGLIRAQAPCFHLSMFHVCLDLHRCKIWISLMQRSCDSNGSGRDSSKSCSIAAMPLAFFLHLKWTSSAQLFCLWGMTSHDTFDDTRWIWCSVLGIHHALGGIALCMTWLWSQGTRRFDCFGFGSSTLFTFG